MKTIETKIADFSGGMSDSLRELSSDKFSIAKHFDLSDPKKLIPYRNMEAVSFAAGLAAGNFLYNSSGELCILGKANGQNWFSIYYNDDITGSTFEGGRWAGTEGVVKYLPFIEFNGKMYLCQYVNPNYELVSALIASPYTVDQAIGNLSSQPTGQGVVHSKSLKLFIPCGNKIDVVSSAGVLSANQAPNIDSKYKIYSVCEWGDYLAIAIASDTGSKLLIWDMVSTTTFIEHIAWDNNSLQILNNLEGHLIGVSCSGGSSFLAEGVRISIKAWNGGNTILLKEIYKPRISGTPSGYLIPMGSDKIPTAGIVNFVNNNKLYFYANINDGSNSHIGIWSIGRRSSSYPFAVNFERFATTDNSETLILSAILLGDYLWAVHTAVNTVVKTDDQFDYLSTSIYESQKFNGELHGFDSSWFKKLVGVSVQHDKLPADATVAFKYRVDGATDWTEIFTNTTNSSISHEATNIESSGDELPDNYREIEYRIESYKGAIITGFSFKEEIKGRNIYQ